ncbi:MAG: hypothetical protein EAY81_08860, partial [Bacteroidetes bacterium]
MQISRLIPITKIMGRIWLVILAGIAFNVSAQDLNTRDSSVNRFSNDSNFKKKYFHYGTNIYLLVPSVNFSNAIQLNEILKKQGAPAINNTTFMTGISIMERFDVFSGGIEFITGSNASFNDKYEVNADFYMINFSAKLFVNLKGDFGSFYPFIGFNGHTRSVYVTDLTNTNNITGLFQNSGSVNLKYSSYFLNGGIGYDFFNFQKETSFYGSIQLGIRGNVAPKADNTWYVNEDRQLQGSPIE